MRKSRITAAILAFVFGSFGVHKFYLKKPTHGLMYIFLAVAGARIMSFPISQILGMIDAVRLLLMSDQAFDAEYNSGTQEWQSSRRERTSRTNNRQKRRQPEQRRRANNSSRSRQQQTPQRPRFEREHTRKTSRRKSYPKSNPYKQSGIRKFKDYDIKGAIEDFTKALSSAPDDASIHFNLACSYSLNEESDKSYSHLSKAVENGFKDFEKISTHEALAFLRIQDGYEEFVERGYRGTSNQATLSAPNSSGGNLLDEDVLLKQLNKLSELRQKGLLSEQEFIEQKRRLMD